VATSDLEFSASELQKAIESLRPMLGETVVDGIIYDLELYGLLSQNNSGLFGIEQIEIALERIFGEAASFLMRPITDVLVKGSDLALHSKADSSAVTAT
jgi:hypothetical protein